MLLKIHQLKSYPKIHTWEVGTANEACALEFPTKHSQCLSGSYIAKLRSKDVETWAHLRAESTWHRTVLPNTGQGPAAFDSSPKSKEGERCL